MALLLAGGIVFRIFRKVALFAGFGNGGNHVRTRGLLEIFEFGLELFSALGGDGDTVEHGSSRFKKAFVICTGSSFLRRRRTGRRFPVQTKVKGGTAKKHRPWN